MNRSKNFLVVPPIFETTLGVNSIGEYTREQALTLIWRHTHRDYRSDPGAPRAILVNGGAQGTLSVLLDALTDDQIEAQLPSAHRAELKRLAAAKTVRS